MIRNSDEQRKTTGKAWTAFFANNITCKPNSILKRSQSIGVRMSLFLQFNTTNRTRKIQFHLRIIRCPVLLDKLLKCYSSFLLVLGSDFCLPKVGAVCNFSLVQFCVDLPLLKIAGGGKVEGLTAPNTRLRAASNCVSKGSDSS